MRADIKVLFRQVAIPAEDLQAVLWPLLPFQPSEKGCARADFPPVLVATTRDVIDGEESPIGLAAAGAPASVGIDDFSTKANRVAAHSLSMTLPPRFSAGFAPIRSVFQFDAASYALCRCATIGAPLASFFLALIAESAIALRLRSAETTQIVGRPSLVGIHV